MDVTTSDNSAIENLHLLYLLYKSSQQLLDNMFAIFSCLHSRNFFGLRSLSLSLKFSFLQFAVQVYAFSNTSMNITASLKVNSNNL